MKDHRKTKAQLITELNELRARNAELEQLPRRTKFDPNSEQTSYANMAAVLENTDACILLSDTNGYPLMFNSAYAKLMKDAFDIDMKPGVQPHKLMADEGAMAYWDNLHQRVLGGENFTVEFSHSFGPDDLRHFEISFHPIIENDEVVGFSEFSRDVTSQIEAEEALRESEAKYSALVERANDGVFIIQDALISFVNPALASISGYSAKELIGMPMLELAAPESREMLKERHESRLAGGNPPSHYEAKLQCKDGTIKDVELSAAFLLYEGRSATMGIMRDMTERKRIEEARRTSEARFRAIFEHAPLMMNAFDEDGRCILWNKECEKVFGWTTEEINAHEDPLSLFYPDPKVRDEVVKSVTSNPDGTFREWHPLTKDGEERVTLWANFQLPDGAVISLGQDITERKEVEKALQEANERLEDRVYERTSELAATNERLQQEVIERARAEQERRSYEERLALHVQQTPFGVIEWDMDFKVASWNPAAERIFGYSRDEALGRLATDLIVPQGLMENIDGIWTALKENKGGMRSTNENITKDGRTILCEWYNTPLVYASGRVVAVASLVHDITEKVRAEEATRLHAAIMNNVAEGICLIGCDDLRIKWTNERFTKMFGYDPGEMKGELVDIVNAPTDRTPTETRTSILDILKETGEWHGEVRNIKRDGTHFWCYANVSFLDHTKYGRVMLSVSTDITERKQAERTLHRQSEAIEQALDGIGMADLDGNIQFVNKAYAKMHGYSQDEIQGKHISLFHTRSQMDTEVLPLLKAIKGKGGFSGEIGHVKKDGTVFPTWMSCSILKDEQGTPTGMTAITRDISKEIELETQLRHAQKMEAIGTLAGGVAHNLRNILSSLLGWLEIAERNPNGDGDLKMNLEMATQAGWKASDHVKQLLTLSRRTKLDRKPVNIGTAIREGIRLLKGVLPTTIELKTEIDEDCGPVMADMDQMQQVLMNLGTNASHAMENSGTLTFELKEIELTFEESESHVDLEAGKYAQITVTDTGCGMTDEVADHIFEPFFTTKEQGEGTGLGLSIVHGIVQAHEGATSVQSESGKGTSFTVLLPVCGKSEAEIEEAEESPKELSDQESGCLLLVDDDKLFAEMAKAGLEMMGYTVETFTNAVDALDSFSNAPDRFDAVILDQIMPELTGLELAEKMRQIRPGVAAILVSGVSETVDSERAKDAGILELVEKPATPSVLADAVRRVSK